MIDPQVAFDKLAQFEDPDEIAEVLIDMGIQGYVSQAESCAISAYMNQLTGRKFATSMRGLYEIDKDGEMDLESMRELTIAMYSFVIRFDCGKYSELEKEPLCDCD